MNDPQTTLSAAFSKAIAAAFGDEYAGADPLVRSAQDAAHGDWQANFAMSLAKRMGKPPRAVAEAVVAALDLGAMAESVTIAGPGFVNVKLSADFLARAVYDIARDERKGVPKAERPELVAVDYSAPNVAKEMHVGHIRSTFIGDAITRVLGFQGHTVLRRNHLGDWGTQFGQLIEHMVDLGLAGGVKAIGDLNALYKESKKKFDADPAFAERARRRVVALQSGDAETVRLWKLLIDESKRYFGKIYAELGVLLNDDDYYGESFYNDMLAPTAEELKAKGVAVMSEGALCAFPPGFKGRDGEPVPLIVQKSDGGYGYDTTDLAALRHRVRDLGCTRLVYVVGAPQKQHFEMIFAVAKMAGWIAEGVLAEHTPFGSILGEDGKMFKTRSGDTVKLTDLLEEALKRAYDIVSEKSPELPEEDKRRIAHAIGIGALKYVDLSNDRIKDYVFSWERMLAFEGNTAPYLQNAYVRIKGIFRKAAEQGVKPAEGPTPLAAPEERALAVELLKLPDLIAQVSRSLEPHRLCTYLYGLASLFHSFYEKCPVMGAQDESTKRGRLALCGTVADTLALGLSLLGIETVDQM